MGGDRESEDSDAGSLYTVCFLCEALYRFSLLISAPGCCGSQARDLGDVGAPADLWKKLLRINF